LGIRGPHLAQHAGRSHAHLHHAEGRQETLGKRSGRYLAGRSV
jgi:hypothetical protein